MSRFITILLSVIPLCAWSACAFEEAAPTEAPVASGLLPRTARTAPRDVSAVCANDDPEFVARPRPAVILPADATVRVADAPKAADDTAAVAPSGLPATAVSADVIGRQAQYLRGAAALAEHLDGVSLAEERARLKSSLLGD